MTKMIKVSEEEIEKRALELARKKKQWHHHLLTPACKFNDKKRHAFVLEDNTGHEYFAYYSNKPAMDLGKRLLTVLHGENILEKSTKKTHVSKSTEEILSKARRLNREGGF